MVQLLVTAPEVAVRVLFPAVKFAESMVWLAVVPVRSTPFNLNLTSQVAALVPTLKVLVVPLTPETFTMS